MSKIIGVIQSRMGSNRLPGKVLADLCGKPLLERVVSRVRQSTLEEVIVATSVEPADDAIEQFCTERDIPIFRGSEPDVLDRYVKVAETFHAEAVVRITGDCPLISPQVISDVVARYRQSKADYVYFEGYANGLGAAELLTASALQLARSKTLPSENYYREHVMTYLTANPQEFRLEIVAAEGQVPGYRFSVDEQPDLDVVRNIYQHFAPSDAFEIPAILQYIEEHPEVIAINKSVVQKT